MDLFEYQAKELFAKHNVPTTPGRVTDTAEGAEAIAEEIGQPGDGQGAGQGRRPRQGRWRQVRRDARRRLRTRQEHPRPGHQGPRRQEAAGRRGQRHRRGVLHLLPARPRQPHLPGDVLGRGRHGDRGGRRHQARAAGQGPRGRRQGCRPGLRPFHRRAGPPARRGARRRRGHHPEAVGGLRRRGRHPGRGQPAGAHPGRPDPRAGRQGHPRRQRRLPPARPRRVRGPRRHRSAGAQGQGERPQLRQARRRRSASSATARAW